ACPSDHAAPWLRRGAYTRRAPEAVNPCATRHVRDGNAVSTQCGMHGGLVEACDTGHRWRGRAALRELRTSVTSNVARCAWQQRRWATRALVRRDRSASLFEAVRTASE